MKNFLMVGALIALSLVSVAQVSAQTAELNNVVLQATTKSPVKNVTFFLMDDNAKPMGRKSVPSNEAVRDFALNLPNVACGKYSFRVVSKTQDGRKIKSPITHYTVCDSGGNKSPIMASLSDERAYKNLSEKRVSD